MTSFRSTLLVLLWKFASYRFFLRPALSLPLLLVQRGVVIIRLYPHLLNLNFYSLALTLSMMPSFLTQIVREDLGNLSYSSLFLSFMKLVRHMRLQFCCLVSSLLRNVSSSRILHLVRISKPLGQLFHVQIFSRTEHACRIEPCQE